MKTHPTLEGKLQTLFRSQKLGILATQGQQTPYTNLIAFAITDNMRHIVFATPKATRKFNHILSNPQVSFFIDNRTNKTADFRQAIGVTAIGTVRQLRKTKTSKLVKLYCTKHPQLESFLATKSVALLCIDITTLYVVQRFQDVVEVHLK